MKLHAWIHFYSKHIVFKENLISKQQNAKSFANASIYVKLISKNSNTLEIDHSQLNSIIIIPCDGFHYRSTDPADKLHS